MIFYGFDGISDVDANFAEKGALKFRLQTTCMSIDG